MVKIYTLEHPLTKEVRYVGKTKFSLNDRLCKHLITKERNHRSNWINSLLKIGLKPIIQLIEEVEDDEWKRCEQYWISQFRTWGFNLVNLTEGGESGIISEQCRKACIAANTGVKQSKKSIEKRMTKLSKQVIAKRITDNRIQEFKSASEAARELNCNLSHVTECCNGIRTAHKGYRFKYK